MKVSFTLIPVTQVATKPFKKFMKEINSWVMSNGCLLLMVPKGGQDK